MEQRQNFKLVNDPPLFSGRKKDLYSFLTRVELFIESNEECFANGRAKVSFIISYFISELLEWAATLKRNNDPILNTLEDFLRKLRRNFGDPELEAFIANRKLDNIRQSKYDHVFEYINEFKRIAQNFNFNDSTKRSTCS